MKFNTSATTADDSNFFIPQQFTEAFETKNVEGVRIILKKIEGSDLSTIKALFMDPTTAGYLEGSLPQESDWQQGARMYNKFCTWVQRSQEKELSWWIIKPKNSSEVLGALGLKQDKQEKVIELCVLMSSKCLQPESVASEAIWFSFWWYHNMDLVSKQYNLQECTVQIRSHINNLMCQRLCMSFGLKTNNQIAFLDEKHPCLVYSARVMDIYNSHFLNHFPVFLQPQANPAPLLASELVVPMFQQQYYMPQQQQQQQVLTQQLANLVTAMAGYQQNQLQQQQQALFMNPQVASVPLATTKLEVKQQEIAVRPNDSNQGMMSMEYAEAWTSKLLSSNAKKVEMASPAAAAKDYLPCLDTNQLTTIGTISVNDLQDEQDVTVRVQLLTHDGTMLLQANKSKRRKSAVSGEKLQHSVFHLDQDNTVEIRLQAGNVVKAGASRKRCYAKIELMNAKNQVIDSMNTIPFFVIAKLNYKSYQDKIVTEPKREAVTPAPAEQQVQQMPQQAATPAPMMNNSAGFAENAPIIPNPMFSNPQQTLHWLSQQQFPQHAQQNPTFLYDNQSFLTSLQAATIAAALWPNNANPAATLSASTLNLPVQATTAAIIPPSLLNEVMTLQQSLQIPLLAQQQQHLQMPVNLEPIPMDDLYLPDHHHDVPEASVPLDNLDAFFDTFSATEY